MKSVFLTAILSVSLTVNVMTYAPQFTRTDPTRRQQRTTRLRPDGEAD